MTENQSPVLTGAVPTPPDVIVGYPWSYTFPKSLVSDPEGESITYT